METMDRVMLTAIGLSMKGVDYPAARSRLVRAADGDRAALEVAHTVLLRDGIPRVHIEPGQARGVRNRALNLLEYAIDGATEQPPSGQFEWSELMLDG